MGRPLLVVALLAVSVTRAWASGPAPEPGSHAVRYVSAQAYFQAMRAEILAERGDLDGAAEALALALVYDPESYHLHVRLARLALETRRGARVDRLVEQAIRLAPRRAAAWRLRGDAAVAEDRPADAVRAYTRAVAVEPASDEGVRAAVAWARLESKRGHDDRARDILERAASRSGRGVVALAELVAAGGDPWGASRVHERAAARFADDRVLARAAAEMHARAGRAALAWASIERLLVEDAELELLVRAHALALADGRTERALELRRRIDGRGPEAVDRARVALDLIAAGDEPTAAAWMSGVAPPAAEAAPLAVGAGEEGPRLADIEAPASTLRPDEVTPGQLSAAERARIGAALWIHGARAEAERWLAGSPADRLRCVAIEGSPAAAAAAARRALAAEPEPDVELAKVAALQIARGEGTVGALRALDPIDSTARVIAAAEVEAPRALESALARLDADRARGGAETDRAMVLLQSRYGSLVRAERLAERMTDDPEAVALLGRLRAARRARLSESLALVTRALRGAPDHPALLGAAGRLLAASGRPAEAEAMLARAVWLAPHEPLLLEHWGDARRALGDTAGARTAWTRAARVLALAERAGEHGASDRRARVREKLDQEP